MSENVNGLSGTVAPSPKQGVVCEGEIVSIAKGTAIEFMSADQCFQRKTPEDTAFIMMEIGVAEYGTIQTKSFRDYGGADGKAVLSPNTMHGKLVATYENLNVGDKINMIATKKDKPDGSSIMVWSLVLP